LSIACAHILVVEDDLDCREAIAEFLDLQGYTVETVADGLEALAALEVGPLPDLVLTDLRMPRMNGQQLVAALRADPRLARIPVVVMSGAVEIARPLGAVALVHKPFAPDALLRVVDQAVGAGAMAVAGAGARRR
jgi:CheY-like chemotaxis protein